MRLRILALTTFVPFFTYTWCDFLLPDGFLTGLLSVYFLAMSFQEQRTHINTIANLSKALMGATANSRQYFEEALGIAMHLLTVGYAK